MNADLFNLAGKVALITGATRGIGLAIARAYGRAGARLAISSESLEDCTRVAATLAREGIDAWPIAADLSQQEDVVILAEAVLARFGNLDALVCNAGIAPHMGPIGNRRAISTGHHPDRKPAQRIMADQCRATGHGRARLAGSVV